MDNQKQRMKSCISNGSNCKKQIFINPINRFFWYKIFKTTKKIEVE